jgi:hypothetical protein
MAKLTLCVAILWCAACGGDDGSGVDGGKKLVSLSDGEIMDLCQYYHDLAGPERTIDCGGGVMITVGGQTVAECTTSLKSSQMQFPNCQATVSQSEACSKAFADLTDAQLCSDQTPIPASCAPLFTAECGGG